MSFVDYEPGIGGDTIVKEACCCVGMMCQPINLARACGISMRINSFNKPSRNSFAARLRLDVEILQVTGIGDHPRRAMEQAMGNAGKPTVHNCAKPENRLRAVKYAPPSCLGYFRRQGNAIKILVAAPQRLPGRLIAGLELTDADTHNLLSVQLS